MRVLLTQRNSAELYPPVLHQAAILARRYEVTLVDLAASSQPGTVLTPPWVVRDRVDWSAAPGVVGRIRGKLRRDLGFRQCVRRRLGEAPEVAIAFESRAINLLLGTRCLLTRSIAHLHELPLDDPSAGWVEQRAVRRMWRTLSSADLVVVPDTHRARYVRAAARLAETPTVVMNCPMLLPTIPASRLVPWLAARGAPTSRIVQYQGAVGPMKSLEAIVASMREWPRDAIFVLVGRSPSGYRERLISLAAEQGVADRLFFVGVVSYDEVMSWAVGAAVGMTMLEPVMPNWRFSAGASNKRFEYLALGIPQVTVDTPGVQDLFGRDGTAEIASPHDSASIARAVINLLVNPERRAHIAAHARARHLAEYNYEHQFAPVMEWIERHAGRAVDA